MMNQVQQLVSIATDIDRIRPARDPLRIFFIKTCLEALCKLSGERKVEFYKSFPTYLRDEGKRYILDNFSLMSFDDVPDGFDSNKERPNNIEEDKAVAIIKEVEKPATTKKPNKGGNIVLANNGKQNDFSAEIGNLQDENEALKRQLNDIQKSLNKNNQNQHLPMDYNGTNALAPKMPKQQTNVGFPNILRGGNMFEPKYSGKDKIITFYGAKNGIGTTTVAYNVALELAFRRKNVLYIELNDVNPMIAYWYDVYSNLALNNGIDKAILGFETGINKDIDESLITREELIVNSNPTLADNFKKFPKIYFEIFS
jgi:hypothetical protein